ncbi:D-isomer-specific 2-hydroxyacid dehydrogenase-like protein [Gonapodya prolifera JEL478]|uniref:D-isomer-specific 2-hydroxyacid dehydrogenase-like protein n=1 Tax=Gonapodya prolifera (strain JEL478) TaxID=1344416 RepID=A0A139AJP1_GONPJ|nr:D-isomer-specific 2-hydroxyacid dehydrogenase-like protein [Gonapodya prolifera JEL478]|eukprot:KXS17026.1 D-isomer-specific 2-hydroxyacid dehydrogenase-like protein [Gonapodya prolifera JEL478]
MKANKHNLAVLDDYLNIARQHLAQIPSLSISVFHDTLPPFTQPSTTPSQRQSLIDRLFPFQAISAMRERTPFPVELLRALPNLRLILATGTQFESFDLDAAKELGITVVAAPGKGRTDGKTLPGRAVRPKLDIRNGGGHPTTQHTWALILALARGIARDDAAMKGPDRAWQTTLALGLPGSTLGVVGLGRLGAAVARIGTLAWGMRVVCWSANLTQDKADQKAVDMGLPARGGHPSFPDAPTFLVVSKEELFRSADVVTLHNVLSARTRHLVSTPELALMKPSALLVNTSRGPLIDDSALLHTLTNGKIRGAALDVFDIEPLPADSPWRSTEWGTNGKSDLVITPHMGYVEEGLMHTWYEETAENVERWVEGKELLHRLV